MANLILNMSLFIIFTLQLSLMVLKDKYILEQFQQTALKNQANLTLIILSGRQHSCSSFRNTIRSEKQYGPEEIELDLF